MLDNNDEYHFTEDANPENAPPSGTATVVPTAATSPVADGLLQKITRRHILLGLGGVVLLWVFYSLVSYLVNRVQPHRVIQPPVATVSPRIASPSNSNPAVIAANAEQEEAAQLKNKFDQINSRLEEQQNTVKRLDFMLGQLQAQATSNNAILNKLIAQADEQQAKQQALEAAKKKALAKKASKARKPTISYVVKAMVPGRAWLQSSEGESLTVRVGDNLPSAGTVTALDVDQGVVNTSNGAIIQYSPSDR